MSDEKPQPQPPPRPQPIQPSPMRDVEFRHESPPSPRMEEWRAKDSAPEQ